MSIDFLTKFGFEEDPFASTNAADEPLISDYFVAPPYFPSVIGDPLNPKSNVVFAPRGGGKTAQKIMLEQESSNSQNFVCISYDRFQATGLKKPSDATLDFHLKNLCTTLLISLLIELNENAEAKYDLSKAEKKFIVRLSRELLGQLSADQYKRSLTSIKSLGDRSVDIWNDHGGAISALVNAIMAKYDLGKLDQDVLELKEPETTYEFKFAQLTKLLQEVGHYSIYILVDRVDELSFTTRDAGKAFELIQPILTDLPLIETPGVAFKFFLWDQIRDAYLDAGGRPDRVIEYHLEWSVSDLSEVLKKRMSTYSDKSVHNFNVFVEPNCLYNVHLLIAYFAYGSPRDMIRLCKRIVDEHTKSGRFSEKIPFKTIQKAISIFSLERAKELYGTHVTAIKKVGRLNFTISHLSSEVFRVSNQAGRSRVQKWIDAGAVARVGDVPNPGNRPQHQYGIIDPRLAISILSSYSVEEAISKYLLTCPDCANLCIAFDGEVSCHKCDNSFEADEAKTLSETCTI